MPVLHRAKQHGMFITTCISGVAKNLAGRVNSDGIGKGEAGSFRNQSIQIDNPLAVEMKGTCFPALKGL